jgi:hypothetical protein
VKVGVAATATSDDESLAAEEAKWEREGAAFERALEEQTWRRVLDTQKVILWLPEGTVPQSVMLTARQAVGLSDAAARSSSKMVAFVHAGLKVTLTPAVAASLRAKVEEKLSAPETCAEPILIATAGPLSQRATTAAVTQGAAAEPACEPAPPPPRHTTAPSRPRPRPVHPASSSWVNAATLPFRPTTPAPRIGPNPKTTALMRAQAQQSAPDSAAMEGGTAGPAGGTEDSTFMSVVPRPPSRVAPNFGRRAAAPG